MRLLDRALVTGGAGFIGSHLVEQLLSSDHRVTVIDDLSTGEWKNIEHLAGESGFKMLVASAAERSLVEHEVSRHDVVYHLASSVGVRLIIDQPVKTVENIFVPTDVVLRACSKFRRPVVVTSTSEVYGKSSNVPFREADDVVMGPTEKRRWAYACAKALDEFMALAHYYETRLPVNIVRLFNTVGPRQTGKYGMVLPTFVTQALCNEPITVFGDGSQRRSFCSVSDVVRGLLRAPEVPEAAGKVINMGSQEEVSILALAERVKSLCGSSSEVRTIPYEEAYGEGFDDMNRRLPDISRARRLLEWRPMKNLDDIITEIRDYLSAERVQPA